MCVTLLAHAHVCVCACACACMYLSAPSMCVNVYRCLHVFLCAPMCVACFALHMWATPRAAHELSGLCISSTQGCCSVCSELVTFCVPPPCRTVLLSLQRARANKSLQRQPPTMTATDAVAMGLGSSRVQLGVNMPAKLSATNEEVSAGPEGPCSCKEP